MSLILCPTHGESGFCLRFSKQVIDAIHADHRLTNDDVALFKIVLIDDEDGEELYTEQYLLLKNELDNMGVAEIVSIDKEEAYDYYKNQLPELAGICSECFREYKIRHHTNMLNFN